MNQLNSEREAMLVPGAIIEDGSRDDETCTDPTAKRYQVCGVARDHKGEYVVVYQELFEEREVLTCPIQEYLGGVGETKTMFGKSYIVPKFKLCKETVEVSQNILNSCTKDTTVKELLDEIAALRKEVKHINRDLKKLQKLTAPLKEIKVTKGTTPIVQPAPMPTIPTPITPSIPLTAPFVLPTSPTCNGAEAPTAMLDPVKAEAIANVVAKAPDMVERAAKAFDNALKKPSPQKGNKIRMIEEEK